MPRYTKATRTSNKESATDALREEFLRQLTQEAQTLLKQMTEHFNADLEAQSSQMLGSILGNEGEGGSIGGLGQIFSTAARYFGSRQKTTSSTAESDRSQGADNAFRLSQSQNLAEANLTIMKGEKNL